RQHAGTRWSASGRRRSTLSSPRRSCQGDRMSEAWGRPPWEVRLDVPDAPPPSRADVAVIGSGFAGLATAWELVRRGVHVVVLEADRVGAGASGHSGALVLEGTAVGPLDDADRCLESVARLTRDADAPCDLR